MPVVVDGDEVVSDSPAIVEWLERRVPEPPLYPREPARRAEVQVFVSWFNNVWKRPPNHEILVEHQPLGDGFPGLRAWAARVDAHPRA